jgi:osmotically-inducible protein OsmY
VIVSEPERESEVMANRNYGRGYDRDEDIFERRARGAAERTGRGYDESGWSRSGSDFGGSIAERSRTERDYEGRYERERVPYVRRARDYDRDYYEGRPVYRDEPDRRGQSHDEDRFGGAFRGYRPGSRTDYDREQIVRARGGYREEAEGRERRGADDRGWWDRAADEVSSWFGDRDAERRRHADEVRRERHERHEQRGMAGRGPKGYRRSDDRIREDVSDRLTDDDYLDASEIEVLVDGGTVTLGGTVDSRWQKRRAAELAEDVSGVTDVLNTIRVRLEPTEGGR